VRDDSELIAISLAGQGSPASHQDAFDALVARHYRVIYNMLYRMLGNPEDAADLTQETFLRAYSRLDTFELGRSFLAWIRTIASNLCIDHLRRRGNPTVSLDERLEAGAEQADRAPAIEEQVALAEDSRRVLAAVQKLPEKQRAVLVLRHVEGLKLEEIAEALRMPLGTVKTMLFRGRAAVREMVGEL
jgi:RNA polymerase sigma-70 factor (ECF subfamily)